MLSAYLPLIIRFFTLIIFLSGNAFCAGCQVDDGVYQFASKVRHVISVEDINQFSKFAIYPNYVIDKDHIEYVFSKRNERSFPSLLRNKNTKTLISEPHDMPNGDGQKVYTVIFYDSGVLSLAEGERVSHEDIERYWGISYLETLVTNCGQSWCFYRTPFYFGAHAPWESDY